MTPQTTSQPWASGPQELLQHAMFLLRAGSDSDRRIAFICVDNALEVVIRAFLTLPSRVTGIKVPRSRLDQGPIGFPTLLKLLEEFAAERVQDIDFGVIEWYHGLRNKLYHDGNGLTIESTKVETYAGVCQALYQHLFGVELQIGESLDAGRTREYLLMWSNIESMWATHARARGYDESMDGLRDFLAHQSPEVQRLVLFGFGAERSRRASVVVDGTPKELTEQDFFGVRMLADELRALFKEDEGR